LSDILPIEIISAGAGSGKTYTLTTRIVQLLREGVRPAAIVATTFTQKAAAELQERVRVGLLEAGMTEAANNVSEALIGTVHSIGIRLLQRFAFEAGVSPLVEVIAENDSQRMFNESLAQILDERRIETMNRIADRLGLSKQKADGPYDWRVLIRRLTDVARANNFSKDVLKESCQKSWESFQELLPPPQKTDARTWNNRLTSAIDQTVAALEANEADTTKATREGVETLRAIQNQLKWRGELYWHEWAKIGKVAVGAKSRDLMEDLQQLVLNCEEHPDFQNDIRAFIELVFEISMDALGEFAEYKKKRGLIDYTDMETYVSALVRMDSVRDTLRAETDLLLVDEFQDTSPIQLDIFLQLSQLAKRSIWVGDPKQSIYGFRGAEPALMQAVIKASGGIRPENILKTSWRSRADLVSAANAIFTLAFTDLPPEQITLSPHFTLEKEQAFADLPPALHHWHFKSELDERKVHGKPWLEQCVADQVRILLEQKWPVFDKKRTSTRPLQPGDMAILCRNNDQCIAMADALHHHGLKAGIARVGLLETTEVRLALAALKYLLTASDALSVAELMILSGSKTLEEVVNDRLEWLHFSAPVTAAEVEKVLQWGDIPLIHQLDDLRPSIADMSASEVLNLVLDALDLRRIIARRGHALQRIDNIERLRRYALEYESACSRLHSAATLGGFLIWLNRLGKDGRDEQSVGESADTVRVLTYHKSKGLEYPVTICCSLEQSFREQVWGLNLIATQSDPDLNNILGNRWLRFWINPFADQLRRTRLEEKLLQSTAHAEARRIALAEEARLLYVGLTRARDYLILPTTAKSTGWLNRVFNSGNEDIPVLDPHSDETPFYDGQRVLYADTKILYKPKVFPEPPEHTDDILFAAPRSARHPVPRPALFYDLSEEVPGGLHLYPAQPVAFAAPLLWKEECPPVLVKAVQTFMAADRLHRPSSDRLALARYQLTLRNATEYLETTHLAQHSEAFHQALSQWGYTSEQQYVKYPLDLLFQRRRLHTEADLWIETPEQVAIFQFLGLTDNMKKWKTVVQNPACGLPWLYQAMQQTAPSKNHRLYAVFPFDGQVVELLKD
jgi:ATP-dependent exoDNAse (exonuclease V) beta subunit